MDPYVTVNIVEYHSRPISVTGAVRTPTIFQAVGNVTLLDALARAGGLIPDVSGNEIVVTRGDGDSVRVGPADFRKGVDGGRQPGIEPQIDGRRGNSGAGCGQDLW